MNFPDSRTEESQPNTPIRSRAMYRLREPRNAAIVGLLLAAAIVAIFLIASSGDDNSSGPESTGGAEATSVDSLRQLASSVDHPVYWAGTRPGQKLELTITDTGNLFVRYLDQNTPVGSKDVASLTIGTYPFQNAYGALQEVSQKSGAKTGNTPDGGFVVTNENSPQSVYIAYPGADTQIEVFDPDPKTAFALATSGAIVPIS
jgi:hypothetical protein